MSKRKLSREIIISHACAMIEENGLEAFSLRKLAGSLSVQVSSLYNYFISEDDLLLEVSLSAIDLFTDYIDSAREGLVRDEAAFSTADAFRRFVLEHPNLYEVITLSKWENTAAAEFAIQKFLRPIYILMGQYGIEDETAQAHILRVIRVSTHGFCSLELTGEFDGSEVSKEESYHLLVQMVIDLMKKYSKADKEE